MMHLPGRWTTALYSRSRSQFLSLYCRERPTPWVPPASWSRQLWHLHFRAPLFNAAGMFKNGEGYEVCAAQGAGAWMSGTTTSRARMGNTRKGITHPFVPYPRSGSASNWMGLPNRGHAEVAARLSRIEKVTGCPLGASVSSDPDLSGTEALQSLVDGMTMYAKAGVDFIELNESCPNVPHHDHEAVAPDKLDHALLQRLDYINTHFIRCVQRPIPIVVKLSTDTVPELIPAMVDVLMSLGFAGITLGNTSTAYAEREALLDPAERSTFTYFRDHFGGGLSGRVLKQSSHDLATIAARHAQSAIAANSFHVLRCGGIENRSDVQQSLDAGIALCEWYTGYFESFAQHGHRVYQHMFDR